jgi:hypothetical protein
LGKRPSYLVTRSTTPLIVGVEKMARRPLRSRTAHEAAGHLVPRAVQPTPKPDAWRRPAVIGPPPGTRKRPQPILQGGKPRRPPTMKYQPALIQRSQPRRSKKPNYQFEPMVIGRNWHGPTLWEIPTRQREPFPRTVYQLGIRERQPWLTEYYRVNPMARNRAQTEARRIIDWAHKTLR